MLKTNLLISKNSLRCGANCPCEQVWHLIETVSSVDAKSTSRVSVWFVKSFATTLISWVFRKADHHHVRSGADEIGGPQDEARLSWGVAESRWEVQALLLIFENNCNFNFLHQTTFKLLCIEMRHYIREIETMSFRELERRECQLNCASTGGILRRTCDSPLEGCVKITTFVT